MSYMTRLSNGGRSRLCIWGIRRDYWKYPRACELQYRQPSTSSQNPVLFEEQHVAGGEPAAVLAFLPWVGVLEVDVVAQVETQVRPVVAGSLRYLPVDLGLKGWLDGPPLQSDAPQIAYP